jgi:nicotinamide-nucleotide amidase
MSSPDLHYVRRISSQDETPDEVANDVVSILKNIKPGEMVATLAVAESLTGGSLMAALASVEGAMEFFRGGIVTYATPLMHSLLNVDPELIVDLGVADGEVALQMAAGVRNQTTVHGVPTTWGLSTTGIAGPDIWGDKPIGTVFIGISSEEHSRAFGPYHFSGNRTEVCEAAVVEALALFRKMLIGGFHLALATEEQTPVDFQVAPGILKSSGETGCAFKIVNGFNLELG